MAEDIEAAPARRSRRPYVRYSQAVAERLCARLAAGELLYRIARDPDMPTPEAVAKWAKAKPEFAAALLKARRDGGRPAGTKGQPFGLCEHVTHEIFERLCEGESLTAIGRDPTMPSLSTIFNWRRKFPAFDAEMRTGMRIRAEVLADRGGELADAATPETAYLTHVRLSHLRWRVGVMAPWEFRPRMVEPAAAPAPAEAPKRLLWRVFKAEEDAETGQKRVVAYCPNPDTGELEREDEPGWRQAPNSMSLPGGRAGGEGYWRTSPQDAEAGGDGR